MAFETLLSRDSVSTGVGVLDYAYDPILYSQCWMQPTAPACGPYRRFATEVGPAILAVHLSTFPLI